MAYRKKTISKNGAIEIHFSRRQFRAQHRPIAGVSIYLVAIDKPFLKNVA
jgi:hypothetical protein